MDAKCFDLISGAGLEHMLIGKGLAEDKRVINAKTPWSLSKLPSSVLKHFKDEPDVPPSMKDKLDAALEMKGGLAGVSKASGFVQRMMAEAKKKHGGEPYGEEPALQSYRNPTRPLHPESTMKKGVPFDLRKLANADQHGRNASDYGASPFILEHFGHGRMEGGGETEKQKEARKSAKKRLMEKRTGKVEVEEEAKPEPKKVAVKKVVKIKEPIEEPKAEPKKEEVGPTIGEVWKDMEEHGWTKQKADLKELYHHSLGSSTRRNQTIWVSPDKKLAWRCFDETAKDKAPKNVGHGVYKWNGHDWIAVGSPVMMKGYPVEYKITNAEHYDGKMKDHIVYTSLFK